MTHVCDGPQRSLGVKAFAIGLPSCLVLVVLATPPPGVPSLALAVNPLILLGLASIADRTFAPRLGLKSSILRGNPLHGNRLLWWLGAGIVNGAALGLLDEISSTLWRPAESNLLTPIGSSDPSALILGVLCGGLTEEIIMRWGYFEPTCDWHNAVFGEVPRTRGRGLVNGHPVCLGAPADRLFARS